jgi:hypothetical protein
MGAQIKMAPHGWSFLSPKLRDKQMKKHGSGRFGVSFALVLFGLLCAMSWVAQTQDEASVRGKIVALEKA